MNRTNEAVPVTTKAELATPPPRLSPPRPAAQAAGQLGRFGVLIAFIASIVLFSVLRPSVFPTWENASSILNEAAIGVLLAVALTVILAIGDFDLSIGASLGLGAAVTASLLVKHNQSIALTLVLVALTGVVIGMVNGLLVAKLGVNSFIATLAVSSVVAGLEYYVSNQETIYQGFPEAYMRLAAVRIGGVSIFLIIALLVAILLYVVMHHTELGRNIYAIGINQSAARLAGVRVTGIRIGGFVITATISAAAGFLLVSKAGSYYPNAGTSYLLPAFAAAFLGAAFFRDLLFRVLTTVLGVLFLSEIQTGLTQLNLSSWVSNVVQGGVLIFALLLGRAGRKT